MQLCKEQLTYFVLDERDRVEKAIPLFGSWYSKSTSELTDKGMTFAQVTECRIPANTRRRALHRKKTTCCCAARLTATRRRLHCSSTDTTR